MFYFFSSLYSYQLAWQFNSSLMTAAVSWIPSRNTHGSQPGAAVVFLPWWSQMSVSSRWQVQDRKVMERMNFPSIFQSFFQFHFYPPPPTSFISMLFCFFVGFSHVQQCLLFLFSLFLNGQCWGMRGRGKHQGLRDGKRERETAFMAK